MPLQLEIVTPEARVYEQTVDSVVLPTTTGQIQVLPGHIPLLTMLAEGELAAYRGTAVEFLAVDKGFCKVQGDRVSVLTEGALDVQKLDMAAIEAARARAEKALADGQAAGIDESELAAFEAMARLAVVAKLTKERRR